MKYTFGPVPSRRLGMSLGVDIIPYKTCTLDCVYCQLGKTTSKSIQRQRYVPEEEVINEVRKVLDNETNRVDFITFSGSGEPTLNSDIGDMISQIKTFTGIPVAVLTNGSLLFREDVRKNLSNADLVVPSLDAVTEDTFAKVNRPHEDITVGMIVEGLEKFSQEFKGRIWLEIMIVKGINDNPEELRKTAAFVQDLKVEKIHLNTVARPPAENFALAVTAEEMQGIASMFDSRVEVIVDFDNLVKHQPWNFGKVPLNFWKKFNQNFAQAFFKSLKLFQSLQDKDMESAILSLLKRRPCTLDDISNSLGIHRNEAIKYVNHLTINGAVRRIQHGDKWYYENV